MSVPDRWRTASAAFVPCGSGERLLVLVVVASLPAAAFAVGADPGATAGLLRNAGVALATAALWERLFATLRGRAPDTGWIAGAWLYALLLPPGLPVAYAAAGMSFGAVFGMHVFGGSGRYVASPAVVGALFLTFAYPSAGGGGPAIASLAPWPAAEPIGAPGFLAACVGGALVMVVAGAASWRTLAGGVAGLFIATLPAIAQGDALAPVSHAAGGLFAVCWAFVLSDPTTQALTRAGRYLHGVAFALLVVLIREADPRHPDGVLTAVLLAGLLVPLFDAMACEIRCRLRGTALELR